MDATFFVGIASVPERAQNLDALLDDLADQTVPLTQVAVFLNGWDAEDAMSVLHTHERRGNRYPLWVDYDPTRRPAGYRWRYFAQTPACTTDTAFVSMLDDDLRVHPHYLARTYASFTSPSIGVVSWTGHADTRKHPYYGFVARMTPTRLWIAGAGTSMVRGSVLQGMTEHELADELLASGGDDETLVSLHAWQRGYTLLRPAGALPVRSVGVLQDAPTASHKMHGSAWEARRAELQVRYTWGTTV